MNNQRIIILILIIITICIEKVKSQDLNAIDGGGFNIATGFTPVNAPENTVILGLQNQYDANYKWQLVHAYSTGNFYLRSYQYSWGNYFKIWHSGNFNPTTFISSSSNSLVSGDTRSSNFLPQDRNAGVYFDFKINTTDGLADANYYHGVMTFRPYGGTNDFSGCLAHQLAFTDNGNLWLRSGSNSTWSSWTKIYSDKNLNRSDIDFNAKNLYANGNIWAKEVRVALTNPWADFVFAPAYKLKTLSEVEQYIKTHNHLPEIPSAKEVEQNGVNVGDMQAKLLQKVEELTLYSIEQAKANKELKQILAKQEQEMKELKELVMKKMK